jgi:hypothetical protein
VAATASSTPALTSTTKSAAAASGEAVLLVTATVTAPQRRARSVDSIRSGEPPDWLTAMKSTPARSGDPP